MLCDIFCTQEVASQLVALASCVDLNCMLPVHGYEVFCSAMRL